MSTPTATMPPEVRGIPPIATVPCVILHGVSWETYERLLAEHPEDNSVHFTYDCGVLQIMVLSARHEEPNRTIALLVEFWALANDVVLRNLGSTTFKRQDLARGFEPDTCFYITNVERIRDKDEVDLAVDPAPDLIIEIDITSPSLNRLPIFAAVGVPEVWRYDGQTVTILTLVEGSYQHQDNSQVLPGLTRQFLMQFLTTSRTLKRTELFRSTRVS